MLHTSHTSTVFVTNSLGTHLVSIEQFKVILRGSLSLSSEVMALERSVSRLNPIISGRAFDIDMETVTCLDVSGELSQILKGASCKGVDLYAHKEILRRRNLKVPFIKESKANLSSLGVSS